jgi:glutamate dehydrogenase/leucine dehydrogenase
MVIVVDSTLRGSALGGCRWRLYPNLDAAVRDAVELAAAMTNKAALAELPLGGGKAVVLGDPALRDRSQLLAFGEFVDSLGGEYITAEDMGTSPDDMTVIAERTAHVVGLPTDKGGCGDPAPYTAQGVYMAIGAALGHLDREIRGARVAVQGAGAVGGELARILLKSGASVVAADTDRQRLAALPGPVDRVSPDKILAQHCDVFAPCGPPGVIDFDAARALACAVVCGAANNPLSDPSVAPALAEQGILYVPDFLANAGGIIHLAVALNGGNAAETRKRLAIIPRNFQSVMARAKAGGVEPLESAMGLARGRLRAPNSQ